MIDPCPDCGKAPGKLRFRHSDGSTSYWIVCHGHRSTHEWSTYDRAIDAWNQGDNEHTEPDFSDEG